MPTQTFFNLPSEKRQKILDCAIEEFSANPYQAASLSKIVENAGISKGSMYQYFTDKKDLYLYLLQVAGELKLKYLDATIHTEKNFFELLRKVIIGSSKFSFENQKFSQLVVNIISRQNDPFYDETFKYMREASENWIRSIVIQAQKNGYVRTDIDLDFVVYFVNKLIMDFGPHILEKYNYKYQDLVNGIHIPEEELNHNVDYLLKILQEGIGM